MEYVWQAEPIKVHGAVVASYGSELLELQLASFSATTWSSYDIVMHHVGKKPALGCPAEYVNLKGSSREHPVVCKYTGNKYYSDDWRSSH